MTRKLADSVVSGGTLFLRIMTRLARLVRELGGSAEDLERLAAPEGDETLRGMARLAVARTAGTLRVTVDYGASLDDMIQAGRYDWAHPDISVRHFPILGTGVAEVDIALVPFDRPCSTEWALAELERRGQRPALLEELLALGARHPEAQRASPIVALGSVWRLARGPRGVVCLHSTGRRRDLLLHWIEEDWDERWRFAAVRR